MDAEVKGIFKLKHVQNSDEMFYTKNIPPRTHDESVHQTIFLFRNVKFYNNF